MLREPELNCFFLRFLVLVYALRFTELHTTGFQSSGSPARQACDDAHACGLMISRQSGYLLSFPILLVAPLASEMQAIPCLYAANNAGAG